MADSQQRPNTGRPDEMETSAGRLLIPGRLLIVLLLALLLRLGTVLVFRAQLEQDPDSYMRLARSLAAGEGFVRGDTQTPTAFRPPLYPVMLTPLVWLGGGPLSVGLLQAVLGTLTVGLTWWLARLLGLGSTAWWAALIVAVDPLSVLYVSHVMTETTAAMLTTLLAALLVAGVEQVSADGVVPSARIPDADRRRDSLTEAAAGAVFGLAALCRPTLWAAVPLLFLWRIPAGRVAPKETRWPMRFPWKALIAAILVSAPWVVRNTLVLGRPILTTTHGGYTLLLGNNPVFYREVVHRPWGTVWDGESLSAWKQVLEREMRAAGIAPDDEVARDRWMYRRALAAIAADPTSFARACWLRFCRFWNVAPLGPSTENVAAAWRSLCERLGWKTAKAQADHAADVVSWTVVLFWTALLVGGLLALVRLSAGEWVRWGPLFCLIAAFSLVHLFFWSNARMRTPIVPVTAVLAVRGWQRGLSRRSR